MNQTGSVTPLAIGLMLVVLATAGVAVDGTRAFLYRRTLQNAADAAALAGAAELDVDAYYGSGGSVIRVGEGARRAALGWAQNRGVAERFSVEVSDGEVRVHGSGRVPTLFLGLIGIDHLPVEVTAYGSPLGSPIGSI